MPATIDATVGGVNANSFGTEAEALTYFETRMPLTVPWEDVDDKPMILIMATRVLVAMTQGLKVYVAANPPYYITRRKWTGTPATITQRLPWPRIGMSDRNGNAIAANVVPLDLKEAQFELAGQLMQGSDRTLDNDVVLQGLRSVSAGSVSLSFKDAFVDNFMKQAIPEIVLSMLVPSWLTDEVYTAATGGDMMFDVVSD